MVKWIMNYFGMSGSKKTQKSSEKNTGASSVLFELKTEGRSVVRNGRLTSSRKKYTSNDLVR